MTSDPWEEAEELIVDSLEIRVRNGETARKGIYAEFAESAEYAEIGIEKRGPTLRKMREG